MPIVDGFDATIAIRNTESGNRRIPIIAVTANANSYDKARELNAGMDDDTSKAINEPSA